MQLDYYYQYVMQTSTYYKYTYFLFQYLYNLKEYLHENKFKARHNYTKPEVID